MPTLLMRIDRLCFMLSSVLGPTTRLIGLGAAVLFGAALHAQSAVQLDLDTTGAVIRNAIVTNDGGRLVLMRSNNGGVALLKIQADGTPLWCERYGTEPYIDPSTDICAAHDDGSYIAQAIYAFNTGEPFTDSTRIGLRLARMSSSGTVLWERVLHASVLNMLMISPFLATVQCGTDPMGVWVFLAQDYGASGVQLFLARFQQDGTLAWTRQIGRAMGAYVFWPDGIDTSDRPTVTTDNAGAFYVVAREGPQSSSNIGVIRIDENGELSWHRTFRYMGGAVYGNVSDATINENGDLVALAYMQSSSDFTYTVSVTPSGELIAGHLYLNPTNEYAAVRRIAVADDGSYILKTKQSVSRVDANTGDLLAAVKWYELQNGPTLFSPTPAFFALENDHVVLFGATLWTDTLFLVGGAVPTIWTVAPEVPDGCLLETNTLPHYAIPDSIIEVINDTTWVSVEVVHEVRDTITPVLTLPTIGAHGSCSALVGINELSVPQHLCSIRNNCVLRGTALVLDAMADVRIDLLAEDGRLIHHDRHVPSGTSYFLSTADLEQAVYIIRVRSARGDGQQVWRFVVQ